MQLPEEINIYKNLDTFHSLIYLDSPWAQWDEKRVKYILSGHIYFDKEVDVG